MPGLRSKDSPLPPSPEPLPGERKHVVILFTDIVGSTPMAEKLDPEEWREIVSGSHRIVGEAVRRYEGTVAQLLGDGVLAFFGAPQAHEDDPQRAVQAALEIRGALQDYRRQLARMVDDFQMRVGIHAGTVVVGQVGDGGHQEYLAVGEAVNLAARLQSAAPPGGVLVSQAVARRVSHICELQDMGEIHVKGISAPVRVYQALALKESPEAGRGLAGLRAPLVGREAELTALQGALGRLEAGQGGIVFVLGEAGIGKSRLVEEARRTALPHIRWLEGRSLSYGAALSYWAIIQLILQDLELSEGDPEPRIRIALGRRLEALFGARRSDIAPYLQHLLGLRQEPEAAERLAALGAETLRRQVLVAISAYFSLIAEQQPLALVFEDLHWADASTLQALERLFPLTQRLPLLLVCLARPERTHGSWRLKQDASADFPDGFTEIHLKQLSECETEDLVSGLLESGGLPESFCRQILERAEGNPFYIEEILGGLIDQGTLARSEAGWQISGELEAICIPDTIQGVLLARIDSLQEDVRQTLQQASVIGRSFLYRLLQAISEAEAELDWQLAQLQRSDLVREKTRLPELEYIFKHSLTQEAAYSSLLIERRKAFHRKVAEALESLFADRIQEFYGFLAHHYEFAGEQQKASAYWLKAGDKARLENAIEEAKERYGRAISLLEASGDQGGLANTWLKLGLVHQTEFDFTAAHRAYEQAFALQRQTRASTGKLSSSVLAHANPTVLRVGKMFLNPAPTIDLDPGKIEGPPLTCEIIPSLFAGLGECDFETNVVPHLARSWEVLDDGMRYIFHLRDNVRWTDGTPLTAEDIEWAWKRNLAPGVPDYPANLLDDVRGARRYRLGENPDPESLGVRALDPLTLEVRLENPVPYFIYLIAFPVTFPLPRHIVERYGDDWWKPPHGCYSGPFRLVEFSNSYLRLERNLEYSGDFPGNLDKIVVHFARCYDSLLSKRFLEKNLDILEPLSPGLAMGFPPGLQYPHCYLETEALLFNPSLPPLDDLRVRQALACGLDFKRFVETSDFCFNWRWTGGSGGLVPPGMAGHSPELGLPFDLSHARSLLAEAGYPDGVGFPTLKFSTIMDVAKPVELIRQLKDNLGIQCDFLVGTPGSEFIAFHNKSFTLTGWITDYPDPNNILQQSSYIRHLKDAGWKHTRYFQLIEEAGKSMDQKRRMALYREADRILVNEETLAVPLSYGDLRSPYLVHPWVSGCGWDVFQHLHYKNIRLERESGIEC